MSVIDIESKIWKYSNTGTTVHCFVDGVALCRSSVRRFTSDAGVDYSEARDGYKLCKACDRKFNAVIEEAPAAPAAPVLVNKLTGVKVENTRTEESKEEESMTNSNITPEMIQALANLRELGTTLDGPLGICIRQSVNRLDNAGIFAAIDEATGYGADPEPELVSKCTCPGGTWDGQSHLTGCPGDPAEWGDLAVTPKA